MTTVDPSLNNSLAPRDSIAGIQRAALSSRARRTRLLGRASLAAPVLGAAAGTVLALLDPRSRPAALGLVGASVGFGLFRWQLQRLFTENVPYEVQTRVGTVQIRRYPAQIWAETVVEQAGWSDALSEGFERLADYIFGSNMPTTLVSTSSQRPGQAASSSSERLSMTAPVLATVNPSAKQDRVVAFIMPADRQLQDLPTPRDPRVLLRAVPARRVAVLAFNGDYKSDLPADKSAELLEWLRAAGLNPKGPIVFAGYDPPTTVPVLRRNEVMVELDPPARS
jgi:SOUL heme-binding protein